MSIEMNTHGAQMFVNIARLLLALGFGALLLAWIAELAGGSVLGLSQPHLFSDATVLTLLAIGCFLDAGWHALSRNEQPG